VLGTDFARTLRAAQAGEEDAFVRLWRDANPAMIRYLRVVGHDDPYDEACEGWVTVVRGLPGFSGDELAWRVWLLPCARQRAEVSTLRRAWGSVTVLPGLHVDGDGEIDIDELLEPEEALDPAHRGITDTLTALRSLPLGQGEVVVLRLGAELPPGSVADVIGVDEVNIERAEARALERLGTDAELLAWSLAAPATRAELADEQVAVSAFRKVVPRGHRSEATKVIALGAVGTRAARRVASDGPWRRSDRREDGRRGERRAHPSGQDGVRGSKVAGRSRTAVLAVTALSVSAMSLGGLGAAAYVGVLPDQVQQAMHDAIGAPAPGSRADHDNGDGQGGGSLQGKSTAQPVTPPTAGVGPSAASSPAAGLCRAWASDKAKGTARDRSVAFRNLSTTAGGTEKVDTYCAGVLAVTPSKGSPTASTGSPSTRPTGGPTHAPKTSSTKTATTLNTHSPTKTTTPGSPAQGRSARTSTATTTEAPDADAGTSVPGTSARGRGTSG
jgi:DNA-directed RNA polymerase specialized sigma24 family protein